MSLSVIEREVLGFLTPYIRSSRLEDKHRIRKWLLIRSVNSGAEETTSFRGYLKSRGGGACKMCQGLSSTGLFLSLWTSYEKHYNYFILLWNCLTFLYVTNWRLIYNCHFILCFKKILCPVQKYKSVNLFWIFSDNFYAAPMNWQVFGWDSPWKKNQVLKKSWKSQNLRLLKKVCFVYCVLKNSKNVINISYYLEDKDLKYQENTENKLKINFLSPKIKWN